MKRSLTASVFVAAAALATIAWAPGCAQLLRIQGQAAEKIAQGISEYCKNTDAAFREDFRAEVNSKAAPNSATIYCEPPAQ